MPISSALDRRQFVSGALAASAAAFAPPVALAAASAAKRPQLCVFTKFMQSLSYDAMCERVAQIGFDGLEATVRRKGHVLPERVKEDLPRHVEAAKKHGLDMTLITTDVLRADDPLTQDVLRTAAAEGITHYRMGFQRYNKKRGVIEQLNELRPQMKELAALNRELGMTAVYQNHSGANFVGASVWDVRYLLEGIPREEIGIAFDIRHATVEGGLSWPLDYDVMKPHVGAVYAKDFIWDGKKPKHVPLGQGRVDPKFFKMHLQSGIECPISLHVEYLGDGTAEENAQAIERDFGVLKKWLGMS